MKISVTDVASTFGRQTRAYAEYRVFSRIARFCNIARDVEISLTARSAGGAAAECVVSVTVHDGGRLRVGAGGSHIHDAINRAAQGIADALRRHGDAGPRQERHVPSVNARLKGDS